MSEVAPLDGGGGIGGAGLGGGGDRGGGGGRDSRFAAADALDPAELETSALVAADDAAARGGKTSIGVGDPPGGGPAAPSLAASPSAPRRGSSSVALPACMLVLVAIVWVGASELVSELAALHAGAPWTMTYVNVSEFAVLLPVRVLLDRRLTPRGAAGGGPPRARTDWRAAAAAAAPLAPVWFLAQGTFNAALSTGTPVASVLMLSTTSTFFTLAIGVLAGDRPPARVLCRRAGGAALIVAGAALVSAADSRDGSDGGNGGGGGGGGGDGAPRWRGDALALASAALYSVYTTLLSRVSAAAGGGVPDDALFGCVGALTAVTALPLVAGLAAGRAEDARPLLAAPALLAAVVLKGLLDNVASNLVWARAVRLSSPVLGTAGLALTIPLALAADAAHGRPAAPLAGGGAALVGAGFLLAALGEAARGE